MNHDLFNVLICVVNNIQDVQKVENNAYNGAGHYRIYVKNYIKKAIERQHRLLELPNTNLAFL